MTCVVAPNRGKGSPTATYRGVKSALTLNDSRTVAGSLVLRGAAGPRGQRSISAVDANLLCLGRATHYMQLAPVRPLLLAEGIGRRRVSHVLKVNMDPNVCDKRWELSSHPGHTQPQGR